MKNLSHHTELLCELANSLLLMGIKMGDMSSLSCLI
jgi:hypothetical protein